MRLVTWGCISLTCCLAAGADDNWQAQVQQRIATEEYRINWQGERFHAANRQQNLRAYFTREGVQIQRRVPEENPWQLKMRLAAVGRGEEAREARQIEPVLGMCAGGIGPGALRGCLRRLDFWRIDVGITEWYVNRPEGLEQGFDVWVPPEGGGELRLEIQVGGVEVRQNGDAVFLVLPTGGQLQFGNLKAQDARHRKLPARLEAVPGKFIVRVDDRRAVYPVTIDPLLESTPLVSGQGGGRG